MPPDLVVRRFLLHETQPSTPHRPGSPTGSGLSWEFNPEIADCGLQGSASYPSGTTRPDFAAGPAVCRVRLRAAL